MQADALDAPSRAASSSAAEARGKMNMTELPFIPADQEQRLALIAWAEKIRSDERERLLPKDAPPGLLMSMAMRFDHALGCPGYYDSELMQAVNHGISHARMLESTLSQMRQLYEEVSGHGFYRPEKEAEYAAIRSQEKP